MPESAKKIIDELTQGGLLAPTEATEFQGRPKVGIDSLLGQLVERGRITKYQADKFRAGQSSDIYFGDYVVLEELGHGGMGTVLLARHRRMEREVAIKVLPVTALESESAVARFYQEVKVAAQLTHPNIVHAYDAGEHHGVHYLVMEYVPGHDLARVLEHMGPIPQSLALDYMLQTAKGLEYSHRKGIVHRDIKPSNLLLNDEGVVKILDMGLARLGNPFGGTQQPNQLTATGQVMGTLEYMSPEQAEDTRLADERSDIYSLGCTLYRLVTGTTPFARDTVVKTILAHRESSIPRLESEHDPALIRLDPLFQKMVAKRPDDRFQSVTHLIQELERLIDQSHPECDDLLCAEAEVEVVDMPANSIQGVGSSGSDDDSKIRFTSEVISSTVLSASGGDQPTIDRASGLSNSAAIDPVITATPADSFDGETFGQPVVLKGKNHRGLRLILAGSFSILFSSWLYGIFGIAGAVFTWISATNDLTEMETGYRNPAGRNLTLTARVLAVIAAAIFAMRVIKQLSS